MDLNFNSSRRPSRANCLRNLRCVTGMMNHAMMRPATMIANNCRNTSLALGKMYVKNTTIKAKAAQNKVAINGTPVAVKFLKILGASPDNAMLCKIRELLYSKLLYTDNAATTTTKFKICAAAGMPMFVKIWTNGLA